MTVPEDSRTAVVRVDAIVRAPEILRNYVGQEITVRLAPKERVKARQQAIFHTNGWLYGKSLAVQSLGHDAVPKAAAAAAAAPMPDPTSLHRSNQIAERATQADLVVSGKVIAMGTPEPPPPTNSAAALAMAPTRTASLPEPISEHAPFWTEAVVDVDQVYKGQKKLKRVTIRFPASTDVRWYHAPKFQVGQAGVFLLQQDDVSGKTLGQAALAVMPSAPAAPNLVFTCLHRNDFVPSDHTEDVEAAVTAAKNAT
jgi:hypothetical protein